MAVAFAKERQSRIVPVKIDESAQVPLVLMPYQYFDLSDAPGDVRRLGELADAIVDVAARDAGRGRSIASATGELTATRHSILVGADIADRRVRRLLHIPTSRVNRLVLLLAVVVTNLVLVTVVPLFPPERGDRGYWVYLVTGALGILPALVLFAVELFRKAPQRQWQDDVPGGRDES